jgi:hypothetical protein
VEVGYRNAKTIIEGAAFSTIKWSQLAEAAGDPTITTWSEYAAKSDEKFNKPCGICYAAAYLQGVSVEADKEKCLRCQICPVFPEGPDICHPSWVRFYVIVGRIYADKATHSKVRWSRVRRYLQKYANEVAVDVESIAAGRAIDLTTRMGRIREK